MSTRVNSPGRIVWLPWRAGPADSHESAVVISLTAFRPHRLRDQPRIYWTGLLLREGWYAMPGAVGLWLWTEPLKRRGGSVSVWESEADLRRFVALPAHLAIMRTYKDLGTLYSDMWHAGSFGPDETRARAMRRLAQLPDETDTEPAGSAVA